jgi:hypothetical protein
MSPDLPARPPEPLIAALLISCALVLLSLRRIRAIRQPPAALWYYTGGEWHNLGPATRAAP